MPKVSADKPYLWNFERTTYTDNSSVDTSVVLLSTEPRAIESITEYYANGTKPADITLSGNGNSVNTIPTGWSTNIPTLDQGDILWNCEIIKYTAVDANG
jgi:hypothetical protein